MVSSKGRVIARSTLVDIPRVKFSACDLRGITMEGTGTKKFFPEMLRRDFIQLRKRWFIYYQ